MDQSGLQRFATTDATTGDLSTDDRRRHPTAHRGAREEPGIVHLLAVGRFDRRPSQPAPRFALGEIDLTGSSIGFARAFVDGVNGPELRPTKTHMPYRVAVDRNTLAVLVDLDVTPRRAPPQSASR